MTKNIVNLHSSYLYILLPTLQMCFLYMCIVIKQLITIYTYVYKSRLTLSLEYSLAGSYLSTIKSGYPFNECSTDLFKHPSTMKRNQPMFMIITIRKNAISNWFIFNCLKYRGFMSSRYIERDDFVLCITRVCNCLKQEHVRGLSQKSVDGTHNL